MKKQVIKIEDTTKILKIICILEWILNKNNVYDHFGGVAKMVEIEPETKRKQKDYKLLRYSNEYWNEF